MFSIGLNTLNFASHEQLQVNVENLSKHIAQGKTLEYDVAERCLIGLNQETATSSKEVLEGLRVILLKVDVEEMDEPLKEQMDTIRGLCDQIIATHCIESDVATHLSGDALELIFAHLSPKEAIRSRVVSKTWDRVVPKYLIKLINNCKFPRLRDAFKGLSGCQVVDWLVRNDTSRLLYFANFTNLSDFDNKCLEKLTKNFPNLEYLFIPDCRIKEDALKHLASVPYLWSLDITGCRQLEKDALKHLEFTPNLHALSIKGCDQLEKDTYKYLELTPNLFFIDYIDCRNFKEDFKPPKRIPCVYQ